MTPSETATALSGSEVFRRNKRLIAEWEGMSRDEQIAQRVRYGGFPAWCFCSTGRINDYQVARFQGLLGSHLDPSWSRTTKTHFCCGSHQVRDWKCVRLDSLAPQSPHNIITGCSQTVLSHQSSIPKDG
jgi:hypothetical protein